MKPFVRLAVPNIMPVLDSAISGIYVSGSVVTGKNYLAECAERCSLPDEYEPFMTYACISNLGELQSENGLGVLGISVSNIGCNLELRLISKRPDGEKTRLRDDLIPVYNEELELLEHQKGIQVYLASEFAKKAKIQSAKAFKEIRTQIGGISFSVYPDSEKPKEFFRVSAKKTNSDSLITETDSIPAEELPDVLKNIMRYHHNTEHLKKAGHLARHALYING